MATPGQGPQAGGAQGQQGQKTSQGGGIQSQQQQQGMARRGEYWPSMLGGSPFSLMSRMFEDMDQLFGLGLGRPMLGRGIERAMGRHVWAPQIDVFERDGQFVVRADLPGMKKDDIKVDINEDSIVLEGERRFEHEENKEGLYHSERGYGSFHREIPLPEGISPEDATANFQNGVLEICLKAPKEAKAKSRRLDISEGGAAGGQNVQPTKH